MLSPHSARRLLQKLLEAGLVTVRLAEAAPAPQPPAIFRRARQQLPPESKVFAACLPAETMAVWHSASAGQSKTRGLLVVCVLTCLDAQTAYLSR